MNHKNYKYEISFKKRFPNNSYYFGVITKIRSIEAESKCQGFDWTVKILNKNLGYKDSLSFKTLFDDTNRLTYILDAADPTFTYGHYHPEDYINRVIGVELQSQKNSKPYIRAVFSPYNNNNIK